MKIPILYSTLFFSCFILTFTSLAHAQLKITSSVFEHNQMIPRAYTCQGHDVNPPLFIEGVPADAESLALIMDDPDAPMGTWVHWVVFNIPPETQGIPENSVPGTQGWNDFRKNDYGGPCPPSGTHRYFFKLYALDTMLELEEGGTKRQVEEAMEGHILAQADLIGLYKKE